jgi:hypothetical protein
MLVVDTDVQRRETNIVVDDGGGGGDSPTFSWFFLNPENIETKKKNTSVAII